MATSNKKLTQTNLNKTISFNWQIEGVASGKDGVWDAIPPGLFSSLFISVCPCLT